MATCLVCGSPKVLAHRRCWTCYRFYKRTGRDRTADEVQNDALLRRSFLDTSLMGDILAFLAALGCVVLVLAFIIALKTPSQPALAPAPLMRPVVTPSGLVPIPGPTRGP
jgi:hypothetical protein